jgi:hypothetical protein
MSRLRNRLLALETLFALARAWTLLRLPFRWSMVGQAPVTTDLGAAPPRAPPSDPQILALARMLRRVVRLLPLKPSCLAEALALRSMLARRGISSVLHFGVRREEGRLAAHAWLEAGGGVVCGGPAAVGFVHLAGFAQARENSAQ